MSSQKWMGVARQEFTGREAVAIRDQGTDQDLSKPWEVGLHDILAELFKKF